MKLASHRCLQPIRPNRPIQLCSTTVAAVLLSTSASACLSPPSLPSPYGSTNSTYRRVDQDQRDADGQLHAQRQVPGLGQGQGQLLGRLQLPSI